MRALLAGGAAGHRPAARACTAAASRGCACAPINTGCWRERTPVLGAKPGAGRHVRCAVAESSEGRTPSWSPSHTLQVDGMSTKQIQDLLKELVATESNMMKDLNRNRHMQQDLIRQMVATRFSISEEAPASNMEEAVGEALRSLGHGSADEDGPLEIGALSEMDVPVPAQEKAPPPPPPAKPVIPDEFKAAAPAKPRARSAKLSRLSMQRSRKRGGLAKQASGNKAKSTAPADASAAPPSSPSEPDRHSPLPLKGSQTKEAASTPKGNRGKDPRLLSSLDYQAEGDEKFNRIVETIDNIDPSFNPMDEPCVIPKPIYIVSDCTGESAAHTVRGALGQFENSINTACPTNLQIHRFVKDERQVYNLAQDAANDDALMVFTFVEPKMVTAMVTACKLNGTRYVDMWSNLLDVMEDHLEAQRSGIPFGTPGRRQKLDENYFDLIQAVEFTRKMDDGANPGKWKGADLLLLGVSRTGKTPLSIFLGQRGYRVANLPLVPGVPPPKELWEIDQERVIGLTIRPDVLQNIRRNRLGNLGVEQDGAYDNMTEVQKEVEAAKKLYDANPAWPVLDVTLRSVEESAARIMEIQETRITLTGVVE